jgi:hypothetical protein
VRYDSPSRGRIEFGWKGPLLHEAREVPLRGFPRYETPWGSAPFPMDALELRCGSSWLRLRLDGSVREASGWL